MGSSTQEESWRRICSTLVGVGRLLVLLLALTALGLSGCARCESKVEYESFVSVPTELAAVEKLDDPPDVVVKIEKRAKPAGGGGGCGHSAVCVVIIPFVLADALFPEKLRIATVTEKGRDSYHGVFRENGQFVQALAFQDGVWKKVALLQLRELGRNLVVEVSRAPPDADGKPGQFEPTSLQKQVDVLTGYQEKLASASEEDRRRRLLNEALLHVRAEALPLAKDHLLNPAETASVKAAVLAQVCADKDPIGSDDERAALMRELDARGPDPDTSVAALSCFDAKHPERARAFTQRVVDAACSAEQSSRAWDLGEKLVIWAGRGVAEFEPLVARCKKDERRLFLRYALRFDLDVKELSSLAESKDPTVASAVFRELDNAKPAHRTLLNAGLERASAPLAAILLALEKNGHEPDADEAKALAGGFIVREDQPTDRAELLLRLERTPPAARGEAITRLEQKLGPSTGIERAALHSGLVMLGQREHEGGAARGLHGLCPELSTAADATATADASDAGVDVRSPREQAEWACAARLAQNQWQVKNTPQLVAFVLGRSGCEQPALFELSSRPTEKAVPERGVVCKQDGG